MYLLVLAEQLEAASEKTRRDPIVGSRKIDIGAPRSAKTLLQCTNNTAVLRIENGVNARMLFGILSDDGSAGIARCIVNDDNFVRQDILRQERVQGPSDIGSVIEVGQHHGKPWRRRLQGRIHKERAEVSFFVGLRANFQ